MPSRPRLRLAAGIAALAVLAAVAAGRRRRPSPSSRMPESTLIAPCVTRLDLGGRSQTNAYLVESGGATVLVDAGWAGDADRILAIVAALGTPGERPAAILLTHVHPDHSGAAQRLADAWDCPIVLHPAERPIAEGDFAAMERFAGPLDRWLILPLMRALGAKWRAEVLERGRLGPRVRELDPGGALPWLEGWTWVPTPGHTPGHVAFVRRADGVVLSGDALVTLRVNDLGGLLLGRPGLAGPPWYTTWDRRAAAGSIATIAALDPTVLGGGHGRPVAGRRIAPDARVLTGRLAREA